MKRYLLSTILLGNLAFGMERGNNEKLIRLQELEVAVTLAISEFEQKKIATEIVQLRKELGRTELYQDLPPGSFTHELDNIIEQKSAATPQENPIVTVQARKLISASHPLDYIFEEIAHAKTEEDLAIYTKDTSTDVKASIVKAVEQRRAQLKSLEASELPAVVKEVPAQGAGPSKYQEKLDLIASFSRQELNDYKAGFNDPDFCLSPSEIDVVNKAIAARDAELDTLNRLGSSAPLDIVRPKKVHFEDVPSDASGSGIAKPSQQGATKIEKPLNPADCSPRVNVPEAAKLEEFNDANSREIITVEGFSARERIKQEDIPAPFGPKNFEQTSDFPSVVPDSAKEGAKNDSPSSDPEFENNILPDEGFKGSKLAQSTPIAAVGKDLSLTPVAIGENPLEETEPIIPSRSPAPEERDKPAPNPAELTDSEVSATPPDPKEAHDISSDAALAAKLTADNQTPGGPALPTLPVQQVSGAGGISSIQELKREAGESDEPQKKTEGETPGGPDRDAQEEVEKKEDGAPLKAGDSSSSIQDQNHLTGLQKTLIAVGVAAIVYAGTEAILAYKSIPEKEWKETSGIVKKTGLVLGKTWENVKKRPSQLGNWVKQAPSASVSLVSKLKSKAAGAA